MRIIEGIEELRSTIRERRGAGRVHHQVGFVPTMGYLHEGHKSLLTEARLNNDTVVLSIFVNPLQFGPNEDFDRYPRDQERDLHVAKSAGVDIVFMPTVKEMYPEYPLQTKVVVGDAGNQLCGASRPGHFNGAATIVLKLFQIVQPDRAYFGMKDAQQVAVIKQVTRDFNVPVEIIPCPIIREADGLAMSSRNVFLSEQERKQAVVLSSALAEAGQWLMDERIDRSRLEAQIRRKIEQMPLANIDYVSVLAYPSLKPLADDLPLVDALKQTNDQELIVALAVKFGATRLIDNRVTRISEVCSYV